MVMGVLWKSMNSVEHVMVRVRGVKPHSPESGEPHMVARACNPAQLKPRKSTCQIRSRIRQQGWDTETHGPVHSTPLPTTQNALSQDIPSAKLSSLALGFT